MVCPECNESSFARTYFKEVEIKEGEKEMQEVYYKEKLIIVLLEDAKIKWKDKDVVVKK